MPVFSVDKRWPFKQIPVRIYDKSTEKEHSDIQSWVQDFNLQLGYKLLDDAATNPSSWLLLKTGGGKSEQIGYKPGETLVTANKLSSMHHEIMHALGFHHEQYHSQYPWNDKFKWALPPKEKSFLSPKENKRWKTKGDTTNKSWNYLLYQELLGNYKNEFGVDTQLDYRANRIDDPNTDHSESGCDFDALMMYSQSRDAALACEELKDASDKPEWTKRTSGKCQKGEKTLSNDEVIALQRFYPNV